MQEEEDVLLLYYDQLSPMERFQFISTMYCKEASDIADNCSVMIEKGSPVARMGEGSIILWRVNIKKFLQEIKIHRGAGCLRCWKSYALKIVKVHEEKEKEKEKMKNF